MTANIHQGEIIMDRASADVARKYGFAASSPKDDSNVIVLTDEVRQLRRELIALRQQQAQEHAEDVQATGKVVNAVGGNSAARVRY
jgi:hypothetical protein